MHKTVLAVTVMILAATSICAMAQERPSPADGGALHLIGQDAAVAKDSNSLDRKLDEDFTVEAWLYIDSGGPFWR